MRVKTSGHFFGFNDISNQDNRILENEASRDVISGNTGKSITVENSGRRWTIRV